MVARISSTRSLTKAIRYNERKVEKQSATLLDAGYFLESPSALTADQKLDRFNARMELNDRAKASVMNFSLSFDSSDQLSENELRWITADFLRKIGFEKQPYLLWEHHDTGHRHVHLVSTTIRADGSRIDIGRLKIAMIKKACRELEDEFGLKKYTVLKSSQQAQNSTKTVLNGKRQTIEVISSAVKSVLLNYRFTCFGEFNAVLSQFGVQAFRGSPASRLYQSGGVMFRVIGKDGTQKSAPVKASRIDSRATLPYLQKMFILNRQEQSERLARLSNAIELCLLGSDGYSLRSLTAALEKLGIKIHLSQQPSMLVTYIDNRTRCAFDQHAAGEKYHLAALDSRCQKPMLSQAYKWALGTSVADHESATREKKPGSASVESTWGFPKAKAPDMLLHDLFASLDENTLAPWELRSGKKKKKRKSLSL